MDTFYLYGTHSIYREDLKTNALLSSIGVERSTQVPKNEDTFYP
jgi:hypothetical protein